MKTSTEAWVLHQGATDPASLPVRRGALQRETFDLPLFGESDALVEPLYGSWEANIEHALSRQPIDVCRARHEDPVVLCNLGVVRVLRVGQAATSVSEGDLCLVMPFGKRDNYGYAELAYAYDAPGTVGLLARKTVLPADLLVRVPDKSGYSLAQWATYGRYFTAWDNWQVAYSCWRAQMPDQDPADNLVFGWGGGVSYAELELARRAGFRVAMTASTDWRLGDIAASGITPVDRRLFPDLQYSPDSADADPEYLNRYRASERKFLRVVSELSGGAGVAIFVDHIGAPLYKATVKALARQGVLTTVGWKGGMRTHDLRASECIRRHLHINTHVWRYQDSAVIRDYQEATGWLPAIDPASIYDFDHVPDLASDYATGKLDTYFPLFQANAV